MSDQDPEFNEDDFLQHVPGGRVRWFRENQGFNTWMRINESFAVHAGGPR